MLYRMCDEMCVGCSLFFSCLGHTVKLSKSQTMPSLLIYCIRFVPKRTCCTTNMCHARLPLLVSTFFLLLRPQAFETSRTIKKNTAKTPKSRVYIASFANQSSDAGFTEFGVFRKLYKYKGKSQNYMQVYDSFNIDRYSRIDCCVALSVTSFAMAYAFLAPPTTLSFMHNQTV